MKYRYFGYLSGTINYIPQITQKYFKIIDLILSLLLGLGLGLRLGSIPEHGSIVHHQVSCSKGMQQVQHSLEIEVGAVIVHYYYHVECASMAVGSENRDEKGSGSWTWSGLGCLCNRSYSWWHTCYSGQHQRAP
jgi:hypothetical protein